MGIVYRKLAAEELSPELLKDFRRFQRVKRCWRKEEGQWLLKDIAFIDDWDQEDHRRVCGQLQGVLASGGCAWGAFQAGSLKGFASVDGRLIGSRGQYAVLAEMHEIGRAHV